MRFKIPIKKGVIEFLEKYSEHKMCIATATDKRLVEYALNRLGIAKYFDFIITSSEVGNSKEYPDIYIKASEYLGEPIANCIVFEDALHAIKTAKSTGFYIVGVYDDAFLKEQENIKELANQYVYNLLEVLF